MPVQVGEGEEGMDPPHMAGMPVTAPLALTKVFSDVRKLSNTLQGQLYRAVHKATDEQVAIKEVCSRLVIAKQAADRRPVLEDVQVERTVLSALPRHANIIALHESDAELQAELPVDSSHMYIVTPFASHGDLLGYLQRNGPMPSKLAQRWFWQLAHAVQTVHASGYIIRDLSLENVLLDMNDDDGQLVPILTDFGQATAIGPVKSDPHRMPAKHGFRAPEIRNVAKYYDGAAADVYSLGVILYSMLTATPPYRQLDDQLYNLIQHDRITCVSWAANLSAIEADLLTDMMRADPRRRPTISQVLSHPWLAAMTSAHVRPALSKLHLLAPAMQARPSPAAGGPGLVSSPAPPQTPLLRACLSDCSTDEDSVASGLDGLCIAVKDTPVP